MPKRKYRQYYIFQGKEVFSFAIVPLKDGAMITLRSGEDSLHLTILHKDGKLSWHISDPSFEGKQRYVERGEIQLEGLGKSISDSLNKSLEQYDDTTKCLTYKDEFVSQYSSLKDDNKEYVYLDKFLENPEETFIDKKDMTEFTVRELSTKRPPLGFIETEEKLHLIVPINSFQMLVYPASIISKLLKQLQEITGIMQYQESIIPELLRRLQNANKKIQNSNYQTKEQE